MMKRALVIGASGGIGRALCASLSESHDVTGLSRREDGLDLRAPDTVDAVLSAQDGPFDVILVASGALEIDGHGPEKALREITAQGMAAQFAVNAIGPALVLRHVPRLMPRDRRAVCGVLSARVGSIGDNRLGGWYGYRAAKAAVNQVIHTAAIEIRRTHKSAICVALHPGTVQTAFTARYLGRHAAVPPAEAAANLTAVIGRLTPQDSGGFFDWSGARVAW